MRQSCLFVAFLFVSAVVVAQRPGGGRVTPGAGEGQVEDAEITVLKDRKIELPQQNRNFEKIPALPSSKEDKKLTYQFPDRKLTVGNPKFTPTVSALPPETTNEAVGSNNVRAGIGNYGRIYAEGMLNSRSDLPYGLTIRAKHNSTGSGPVDAKNSATSQQQFHVNGKYLGTSFKLSGNLGYDRDQFYFYGYRRRENDPVPDRKTIEQVLQKFSIGAGIENTRNEAAIDYSLRTKLTSLNTRTTATELDWGNNFKATWTLGNKFSAHLLADAYITQRVDSLVDKRNLFRVKPSFQYRSGILNVTAGFNAVYETDARPNITATHGYPVVNVDIAPFENIHFFAGFDGDVTRNTLTNFLTENQFLGRKVILRNTNKLREFYAGSKGGIGAGFTYEARAGLATYRNFYVFNNAKPDTSRFEILYDEGETNVLHISTQLGYQSGDLWRSLLKLDAYGYDLKVLENPWHRPSFTATWTNTVTFSQKLIFNADAYFIAGLKGKNFVSNRTVDLPNIVDLNLKTTYLLTNQLSAFVSLNNLLSKNYQRYLYYPRQGLNFMVGLSYSF
ncbi:MAG: TonB-dependent receptor [Cytophagaceae bacterium]|nr:TonB-dependent receptor [Cytophagaceae bacterium]